MCIKKHIYMNTNEQKRVKRNAKMNVPFIILTKQTTPDTAKIQRHSKRVYFQPKTTKADIYQRIFQQLSRHIEGIGRTPSTREKRRGREAARTHICRG